VADLDTRNRLHVGWYELHPDVSLNFQLNRWAATGGPAWVADVRPVLGSLRGLDVWRDKFVRLGEVALAEGRLLHAALHFRCAEFFMVRSDPRKEPLRKRLLKLFCQAAGVATSTRREVPFGNLRLPAWHFPAKSANGTMVVFGGFDSYIEEFFPILAAIQQKGWSVIGFEGPGQGSVLEEQKAPLIPDWHGPVGAVLDAFNLDDVTLVGISLGGCLAIRAAAFEPRVRRVVAFDVLSDFFDSLITTHPGPAGPFVRGMLAVVGADIVIDRALSMVARHSPVVDWGGCASLSCLRHRKAVTGVARSASLANARYLRPRATTCAALRGHARPLRSVAAVVGAIAFAVGRPLDHRPRFHCGGASPGPLSGWQLSACDQHDLRLGAQNRSLKRRARGTPNCEHVR